VHSGGTFQTYTVLKSLPKKYTDRIIVRTYGAGKFLPQDLAKSVVNYVSELDVIAFTSNYLGDMIESMQSLRWNLPDDTPFMRIQGSTLQYKKSPCEIVILKATTSNFLKEHE